MPVLHAELYDNVEGRSRDSAHPWRPISLGPASPFAVAAPSDDAAPFSVVELVGGELAGEAALWDIDLHNRTAHIGISLRPSFRGRGLGTDAVGVLCYYGFAIRGLNRLQIETLGDNLAMQRAATKVGFLAEGTRRRSAWVNGDFADECLLGLLASEWHRGD